MITRRFLIGGAAALVCAPSIVRAASLMPARGIIFPSQTFQYGFTERLYVRLHLSEITRLRNAGMTAHEIAADMDARGRTGFTFGGVWDADGVIGVLRRHQRIQQTGRFLRERRLVLGDS